MSSTNKENLKAGAPNRNFPGSESDFSWCFHLEMRVRKRDQAGKKGLVIDRARFLWHFPHNRAQRCNAYNLNSKFQKFSFFKPETNIKFLFTVFEGARVRA